MQTASPATPTRQRLLDAATRVFARAGLAGATTRAIAQEAGVNEVTLFRHFQTKDRLLAAVVGQNFGPDAPAEHTALPPVTADLRHDLQQLAQQYHDLLTANLALIRAMIGEIQHHDREQQRQVFRGLFRPLKDALHHRIEAAQRAGEVDASLSPLLTSDLFAAMIFTGLLRRAACNNSQLKLDYSAAAYLDAAVDLVLRGAAAPAPTARK